MRVCVLLHMLRECVLTFALCVYSSARARACVFMCVCLNVCECVGVCVCVCMRDYTMFVGDVYNVIFMFSVSFF